jgi:hypothetical protein
MTSFKIQGNSLKGFKIQINGSIIDGFKTYASAWDYIKQVQQAKEIK